MNYSKMKIYLWADKQICINRLKALNAKSQDSYEKKALAKELVELERLTKLVNASIEELNSAKCRNSLQEKEKQEEFEKLAKETRKRINKILRSEKVLEEALK